MKTAIASEGMKAEAAVSGKYARCSCFAIFDDLSDQVQFFENPYRSAEEHAGETVSAFLAGKGVERIIGYEFGMKARKATEIYGIQLVVLGRDDMTVAEVLGMLQSSGHKRKQW